MIQDIKMYKKTCVRKIPSRGPKFDYFTHPPLNILSVLSSVNIATLIITLLTVKLFILVCNILNI